MFHFFSQKRLQNRGFSSGQKRRKPNETATSEMLRYGIPVRVALFAVFAILASLLVILTSSPGAIFVEHKVRAFFVVTIISATLMTHWHLGLPQTFKRNSRITLVLTVLLVQILLVRLSTDVADTLAPGGGFRFLVEPYIFAPMAISLLVGQRHGIFAVVYSSLLVGLTVERSDAFQFIIFSMFCGFVAVFLSNQVRKRSRIVMAGFYSGIACALLALVLGQIAWPDSHTDLENWKLMGRQAIAALMVATLTSVLVSGLLPFFEAVFKITTEVSWIELADLNNPLLKRMTIEAPGTYHHSLMVATLAETAAEEIGANAMMCRVCSYFHDIGKLKKPAYFVENVGEANNPHDDLTPNMSALIVMAHVKDGVDMALKHKLNSEIIDVIREHHGTSLIRFFYHRALKIRKDIEKQYEEGRAHEEDIPEVKEESFRYPGPRPKTRESAIISLADSVESASRSLQKPTPKKIDELIDSIFSDRLSDGQLDDCELTLAELTAIQNNFSKTLRSMLHSRIEYPKIEDSDKKATNKGKSNPSGS